MPYIDGSFIFQVLLLRWIMKEQEHITPIEQHVIDYVLKLRADKNLTQLDIGNIIGVARSFISDVESPNRSAKYNIRHINALADHFGMSPKDFLPQKPFPVDVSDKEEKKANSIKKVARKKGKK